MRRSLLLAVTLGLPVLGGSPALATSPDSTGGAVGVGADTGGAAFDARALEPLRVRTFALTPATIAAEDPARMVIRVEGAPAKVRLRVDLLAVGSDRLVKRLALGSHRTGRRITARWRPSRPALAPGDYTARLHAVGPEGQRLRRAGRIRLRVKAPPAPIPAPPQPAPSAPSAPSSPAAAPATTPGHFPVQGPYTFGGPEARYGAERVGHSHTGQDIVAAEGTPVVSPLAGIVTWRAFQAGGAGHYLVIRARDGRDLAFMHLRAASERVSAGDAVTAGQPIAEVGSTGRSTGPHLHFEIWTGGWWEAGGRALDPLPQLRAWAGLGG